MGLLNGIFTKKSRKDNIPQQQKPDEEFDWQNAKEEEVPPVPTIDSRYLSMASSNTLNLNSPRSPYNNQQEIPYTNSPKSPQTNPARIQEINSRVSHFTSTNTDTLGSNLPYQPPKRSVSKEKVSNGRLRSGSVSTVHSQQSESSVVGQPTYEQIKLLHKRGYDAWKFSMEEVETGMAFTGITVTGNGYTVRYGPHRQGERTVMSNLPLHRDPYNIARKFYYFEVTIKELDRTFPQAILAIGLATKPYSPDIMLGRDNFSTTILSDDGSILRNGASVRQPYYRQLHVGQTIGCGYDSFRGNIFYTIDGKFIGNAVVSDVQRPYHAAISANGPALVQINVGQRTFMYENANPPAPITATLHLTKQKSQQELNAKKAEPKPPVVLKVSDTKQAVVAEATINTVMPNIQVLESVQVDRFEIEQEQSRKEKEKRIEQWREMQIKEEAETEPYVPVIQPRGKSKEKLLKKKDPNAQASRENLRNNDNQNITPPSPRNQQDRPQDRQQQERPQDQRSPMRNDYNASQNNNSRPPPKTSRENMRRQDEVDMQPPSPRYPQERSQERPPERRQERRQERPQERYQDRSQERRQERTQEERTPMRTENSVPTNSSGTRPPRNRPEIQQPKEEAYTRNPTYRDPRDQRDQYTRNPQGQERPKRNPTQTKPPLNADISRSNQREFDYQQNSPRSPNTNYNPNITTQKSNYNRAESVNYDEDVIYDDYITLKRYRELNSEPR